MTTSPVKTLEEAAKDVELHKVHPENFFSELGKSSTFDGLCNGIELKVGFKRTEVKELCSKLVRVLEKLSKAGDSERNKYCSYVRYWLYEQISEIHTNKSAKIADVPFFDKLILAWTVISMAKLKNKCNPENIKDVKLDELKNRIFSYIYFKNIDKIKKISTENGTDCDKYLTYLKSFKSVHEEYKDKLCGESTVLSQKNGTDYFHCNDKDVLMSRITELEKCKGSEKPTVATGHLDPKSVKGEGDPGAPKDKKVSEDTTRPTDSAVVASSSSSSTTVTTTTAVTATKPVTTATTVTATQPTVTTTASTASTTPSNVTTTSTPSTSTKTRTVTTLSTSSSGSQGSSSFWSGLSGLFSSSRPRTSERTSSLEASQTSSSSKGTLSARVAERPVTTTSASSVRDSTVTVTTNTRSAEGSISSTGQVDQGRLTRPLVTATVSGKSLSPQPQESPGYALHTVSSYNSNTGGDTNLETITDVPGTSETLYDKLDS
ncbi:PIR protein, partial [Plasmodium vivax]